MSLAFKDANGRAYPKWEERRLGEVATRVTRKNSNNETDIPLTIASKFGLVDQREYFKKQVASRNLSNYYLLKKGEFAYNKSYSNGHPFGSIKQLVDFEQGALSTLYICFDLDKTFCHADYFSTYFETNSWHNEVAKIAVEGARNHGLLNVPVNDFFNIKLQIPTLPEQCKIADFFSAVDEKIALAKSALETAKALKKASLQRLFSGELAFTDAGKAYPKWEEKRLGEVGSCIIGLTYKPKDVVKSDDKNACLVLRSSNIKDGQLVFTDNVYVYSEIPSNKFTQEGDILICTSNGSKRLVGKSAYINYTEKPQSFGAFMTIFRSEHGKFLYQLFQTDIFARHVYMNSGTTITNLSTKSLNSFKFKLPTLAEQQKIADFFSEVDKKISLKEKKLSTLNSLKKALLQAIF